MGDFFKFLWPFQNVRTLIQRDFLKSFWKKKRKQTSQSTVQCSRAQLRWSTSLRSHQNLLREFGGIAFLLLWERNVAEYNNGLVSYLKAHSFFMSYLWDIWISSIFLSSCYICFRQGSVRNMCDSFQEKFDITFQVSKSTKMLQNL